MLVLAVLLCWIKAYHIRQDVKQMTYQPMVQEILSEKILQPMKSWYLHDLYWKRREKGDVQSE